MSDSALARDSALLFPWRSVVGLDAHKEAPQESLIAELQSARAREAAWLGEKTDLLRRQDMLAQEFEHRLVNSLQIIVSLLSLQSRTAGPEAAAQLTVAANRVASFGRVHHRLHLLDHQECVEFREYLSGLCKDLSDLLFQGETASPIVVEGIKIDIPTKFAIPLGFIVNEMITNAAKYAEAISLFDWRQARPLVTRCQYRMTGRDCRPDSIPFGARVLE